MDKCVKFTIGKRNIEIFNPPSLCEESSFYIKEQCLYKGIFDLKVPDVVRYQFEFLNDKWTLIKMSLTPLDSDNSTFIEESKSNDVDRSNHAFDDNKSILLLLESPHHEEYAYYDDNNKIVTINNRSKTPFKKLKKISSIKPIAPAQGKTGEQIDKWLEAVLSNIDEFEEKSIYKIIIANPVQYQSSVHCLHGKPLTNRAYKDLKEDIWTKLWSIKEIQDDFNQRLRTYKPFLVINSGTENLRKVITSHLLQSNFETKIYETNHPSSWFTRQNRDVKKIK